MPNNMDLLEGKASAFQAPREMIDCLVITIAGTKIRLAEPKGLKSSSPAS
jgi:hypothetical protein